MKKEKTLLSYQKVLLPPKKKELTFFILENKNYINNINV